MTLIPPTTRTTMATTATAMATATTMVATTTKDTAAAADQDSVPLQQDESQQPSKPDGPPSTPPASSLPTTTGPKLDASDSHASTPSRISVPKPSVPAAPSPARRRPAPPARGILKPPPPPAKPTLGHRIRDMVTVVGGGARSLFEQVPEGQESQAAGPSTAQPGVGGALNAMSGRLVLGFSRLVAPPSPAASAASPVASPTASPRPRNVPLPEIIASGERPRPKQPLKRATFLLPSMSITYPISPYKEPWSIQVLQDRERIESTHRTMMSTLTGADYWTAARLVALYESACRGREERARIGIVRAIESLPDPPRPRSLHIVLRPLAQRLASPAPPPPHAIETPLNRHAAEAFADMLTPEWGLTELRLENGTIDSDDALKPILHALLVSGTLPSLSLAGNKGIKAHGWQFLAVFLKKAKSLRFIDLSDTTWDRKSVDYLVQALNGQQVNAHVPPEVPDKDPADPNGNQAPITVSDDTHTPEQTASRPKDQEVKVEDTKDQVNGHAAYNSFIPSAPLLKENDTETKPAAVQTLRMDGCTFRTSALETLAHGVRSSDLRNISLRRNRIGPVGAVALAIMIRDYPDNAISTLISPSLSSLSATTSYNPTDRVPSPAPATVRRPRVPPKTDDDNPLPPIPLVVSSPAGGVTSRTVPEGYKPPPLPKYPLVMPGGGHSSMQDTPTASFASAEGKLTTPELGGASIALQRSVRALDGVERIGHLLTLDLKSNDIRNGVGYIAQVLKRNRTLKVLNLSNNRIDGAGLALLAEALKYNSTLETLDLSNNPCCGSNSEGIAALRTAFTVNHSLKRLFLSDTGLTTDGAISLAEFLPESKSLLHLDLTANPAVETAGILALSVGLKANTLIRCLDVSIPPNSPELAELSQNILQACVRNTELAAGATKEGKTDGLWLPIKKSTLVKQVKRAEEERAQQERLDIATSPEGVAREYVYKLKPEDVPGIAEQTIRYLEQWYDAGRFAKAARGNVQWEPGQLPKKDFLPLLQRAGVLRERLAEIIETTTEDEPLATLLSLNDELVATVDKARGFTPPPRLLLPSQIVRESSPLPPPTPPSNELQPSLTLSTPTGPPAGRFAPRRHMRVHSLEISSPNFSIGDSDGESDAEEVDVESFPSPSTAGLTRTKLRGMMRHGDSNGTDHPGVLSQRPGEEDVPEGEYDVTPNASGEEGTSGDEGEDEVGQVSKKWVEEEGEIFRKGTKLGVVDDEEEDASGEQLKKEILDTPVARSPTRRVITVDEEDEDGDLDDEAKADEGETTERQRKK